MASYSFAFIVLLLFIGQIYGRRHSTEFFKRLFGGKFSNSWREILSERFRIDFRRFDKEAMALFPDVGYQSSTNPNDWKLMVHGWRYEHSRKKNWLGLSISGWVERLAKNVINPNDILNLNGSLNHERLKPFFLENQSNEVIQLRIGDKTHVVQTDYQGQFYKEYPATNDEIQKLKQQQQLGETITYIATGDNGDTVQGVIRLIEPREGISVISDIDDTIKISEVLDKVRLLANTFIHPFKAVPGMAELYQNWRSKNEKLTFHYLSGMPDQLYTLTQEFIYENKFPDGSFHMRHFGWAMGSLFDFLHSESTFTHKIAHLRFFLSKTMRDYVLVGDSGEKDPEIYGTITREYPQRIRAIFIRAIKGEKFDDQRFLTAFQGVPPEKWLVFDDPNQVPHDLSRAPKPTAG